MMDKHDGGEGLLRKACLAFAATFVLFLIVATRDKVVANPQHLTIEACAACHGADGIARDSEVPHLAGQNERYLYNQMLAFRSGRRPHREMRIMARDLSLEEMASIAAYYAALPAR